MDVDPETAELYEQTFIDVPAILDKYKASAEVVNGKFIHEIYRYSCPRQGHLPLC